MAATSTTSLKLDSELKERVQRLAAARRRSAHWVMREAVEQYVSREERREQFRQDALAAWNHYQTTGLHATGEEADAWLSQLEAGEDARALKCHARSGRKPPCAMCPDCTIFWFPKAGMRPVGL
jgi:predicted transcriptional regulator